MKKAIQSFFALAVAAAALTSCHKENFTEESFSKGVKVNFIATQLNTKTEFGPSEGGAIPVLWQNGDIIKGICHIGTDAPVADITVTPQADNRYAQFEGTLSDKYPYIFYALSPASAYISASKNATYGTYLQYAIPTSQSPETGKIDPAAVVLLAQTDRLTEAPAEGTNIPVTFKHLSAYGKLSLKNLNIPGQKVKSIALDFGDVGVAGRFLYEEATDEKEASNHINVNSQAYSITINTSETQNVLFGIGAADISGATLTVKVGVADGSYVKTITVPAGKQFKEGVISSFSIDMSGAAFVGAKTYKLVTDLGTLADGDEIIIASAKGDYATANIQGHSLLSTSVNTNNIQATCSESSFTADGSIYNPPVNVEILAVKKNADGTWMFKSASNGGYLARTNKTKGSNYACYYSEEDIQTEALLKSASWTITEEDAETHAVEMKSNCPLSGLTRSYFRTNIGSSYIFSCYAKGSQDPICFYRWDGSVAPEPKPELTIKPVWFKQSAGSDSWNSYFGGTPGSDRNIAMDDEYVYIAESSATAKLWAISISDASNFKAVNVEGVTGGGAHVLTCPRVIKNTDASVNGGKDVLVCCSLTRGGVDPKLYIWNNGIDNAPTAITLTTWATDNWYGDTFTVAGTLQDGVLFFDKTDSKSNGIVTFPIKGIPANNKLNLTGRLKFVDAFGSHDGVCAYYPFPDDINAGIYSPGRGAEKRGQSVVVKGDAKAAGGIDVTLTALDYDEGTNGFVLGYNFIEWQGKRYVIYGNQSNTTVGYVRVREGSLSDDWATIASTGSRLFRRDLIAADGCTLSSANSGMDIAARVINGDLYFAAQKQNVACGLYKLCYE